MKKEVREALLQKRDELIEKLARKALAEDSGDPADLKSDISTITSYNTLLSEFKASLTPQWVWPALLTSICIAVIGILWSVPVTHTDIASTLDTNCLRASLAENWTVENVFRGSLVHLERLSTIKAPNLGISVDQGSSDAWLELQGGQLALQSLEIKKNSFIELLAGDKEVDLFASRTSLAGRITILGKVTVSAGPKLGEASARNSFDFDIPETIEFSVENPGGVPTEISVHSPINWSLSRPRVSDVSFVREEVSGAAQHTLTSGIRAGSIRFNDSSWPVLELHEGDLLRLNRTYWSRFDVRGDGNLMHVTLNGRVGSVTVGDSATKKEMVPSYLEYLYNRKSLTFFWSAIVFLWGLIWRICKTLFE